MKNQTPTSTERTQPTTTQPERHEPGPRARRFRTGVRAGHSLTVPKLDGSSKDAAYFSIP